MSALFVSEHKKADELTEAGDFIRRVCGALRHGAAGRTRGTPWKRLNTVKSRSVKALRASEQI